MGFLLVFVYFFCIIIGGLYFNNYNVISPSTALGSKPKPSKQV